MKTPLLLLAILLLCTAGFSQAAKTSHGPGKDRDRRFAAYAHALPRLYEQKDFDSISWYIQARWQLPRPEPDIFCLSVLLSIQRQLFSLTDFSDDGNPPDKPFVAELRAYANAVGPFLNYKDPIRYHSHPGFDASAADRDLFSTTTRWADDLLHAGSLDSMETFLCQVYAGRVRYPDFAVWQENRTADRPPASDTPASASRTPPSASCTPASASRTHASASGSANCPAPRSANAPHRSYDLYKSAPDSGPSRRHRFGVVFVAGAGIWIPGGHLSQLGIHPAVDYGFGIRDRLNQYDLFASLRFINAPHSYALIRSDTLYTRDFYRGGYAGFDYTRYLVSTPRWEAGLIAGFGADFFDVADGNDTYLSPTELAIPDFNLGVRTNYFLSGHIYFGIACKYHFLHYTNPGGTPLDGNAFTLDLTIGISSIHINSLLWTQ